jgi:hypothetical protein
MDNWSSAKLGDVANLILGMILFFSPWLFRLSAGAPWHTASTIGWLNLVAGLALIVSPWLLGFQDTSAMTIDAVIGTTVVVLAGIGVWFAAVAAPRVETSLQHSKILP